MATTATASSASITIPADYLEDAQRALMAEIHDTVDALRSDDNQTERESTACILRREMRLFEQVLGATEDTRVEGEQADHISDSITEMLASIVRVQSERLKTTSRYGPMPMGEILDIAERLRWAAQEAIRVSPYLNERLSPGEAGSCTTSRDEAVA